MAEKIAVAWSGGKDSALALYELKVKAKRQIASLFTTVTQGYDRISMHGVRRQLLCQQARCLGYPLQEVAISRNCSHKEYAEKMASALSGYKAQGIGEVAFGDIFLEDVKRYRQEKLALVGMEGIFPLWQSDTLVLARSFIAGGFRAIITCVDTQLLDKSFAGRQFDEALLRDLPDSVDPCGERGEFHSFVYDGPIFKSAVKYRVGRKVLRDSRFFYCDLLAPELAEA